MKVKVWEIKQMDWMSPRLDQLLAQGWQPFAVGPDRAGTGQMVFLRRRRKVKV